MQGKLRCTEAREEHISMWDLPRLKTLNCSKFIFISTPLPATTEIPLQVPNQKPGQNLRQNLPENKHCCPHRQTPICCLKKSHNVPSTSPRDHLTPTTLRSAYTPPLTPGGSGSSDTADSRADRKSLPVSSVGTLQKRSSIQKVYSEYPNTTYRLVWGDIIKTNFFFGA